MKTITVAHAALLGGDHAVLGRNLQDHAVGAIDGNSAVAVVADGCGEGEGSEVGARITAVTAAHAARQALSASAPLEAVVEAVGEAVLRALAALCRAVAGEDRVGRAAFAREHLAATLWVAVARGDEALLFGWGDGVLRVDDRVVVIDQRGRPDYLVAAVGAASMPPVTEQVSVAGARRVAVATDGWVEADLRALPSALPQASLVRWMRRRQRDGAFRDDAAIAELAWPEPVSS